MGKFKQDNNKRIICELIKTRIKSIEAKEEYSYRFNRELPELINAVTYLKQH